MHIYVTIHVLEYNAISAAVLMFGLNNEEQHIFSPVINQNLHQYAGKTFDCITTSVIIIIHLTTLPCVLVQK